MPGRLTLDFCPPESEPVHWSCFRPPFRQFITPAIGTQYSWQPPAGLWEDLREPIVAVPCSTLPAGWIPTSSVLSPGLLSSLATGKHWPETEEEETAGGVFIAYLSLPLFSTPEEEPNGWVPHHLCTSHQAAPGLPVQEWDAPLRTVQAGFKEMKLQVHEPDY